MGKPSDLLKKEEDFNESAKETMDYAFENLENYEENAKVQRIARDEDLPEEAVRENLDELTRTRKKYDFSNHPKSAEFFADPDNASVVGDDVEHYKSLEQTLRDRKEPIFGERTAKLAWNAMTEARASITRALGTIAEGQREKIIRRYLGDDAYERAKAIDEKAKKEGAYVDPIEELSKTENRYAFKEGIDFSRKRTPETVKKAFSEEGAIAGIGEAGGYVYDASVESLATQIPMMAGKTVGAPFYLLNLTEQIAQERAKNSGEEMTDKHMTEAFPWAVGSYALDWIGFKGMIGAGKSDELLKEVAEGIAAKTVVKEGLKAGGREAGTEAFQEGFLEYMGERFGTEAKIELSEMLETGAWAGLAGGGMGVAIGTPSAYLNDRERRIKVLRDNERRRDINSVDGQLTIESVLDVVQQMPSVERSPEHVEKFMQAVGPDKQIIVTNEGLKAASTLGIQIPEGMRSPLGDAVLRISDFVNQVANKPDLMAAIRPHLKMRQEDMTQFEMDKQEGNPELAYLFGKADKASKLEKENRAAIEGVVKAMAGTRRMSEGTARKLTKFLSEYANRYVEDAAKKGVEITPKDAIDAMKLRFVGPKVDMDKEVNFEKAAAQMLPRGDFEAFKILPKSEQLDRVARHYAALPVVQGGLGLPATNTREERENALGVKFKSGEDYVPTIIKSSGVNYEKTVQERKRKYASSEGQEDLFATKGLSSEEVKEQIRDNLFVKYELSTLHEISVGIDTIETAEDAAHIAAAFRKKGQETFITVVTDENGKILEVIRNTIGAKNQAQVFPLEVAAAAANVNGAKRVWFIHNHPSGTIKESSADMSITKILFDMFDGSDIKPMGHIVTTIGKYASNITNDEYGTLKSKKIDVRPAARGKKIQVKERILKKRAASFTSITSSNDAFRAALAVKSDNAIILLDTQNQITGTLTVTLDELNDLRQNQMVDRIYSAIDSTNSSAIILKTKGDQDSGAVKNLANFINASGEIRFLDWIHENKLGNLTSSANLDAGTNYEHESSGVFRQSALPDKITIDGVEKHTRNSNGDYIAADEQGIRNFYEWFGASKVVDAEGRPLVVYHGGKEGIEEFDAGKAGSIQSSDWGRGIYFTPTEWVANSYKEDANKATNEAANAAWDAIEAKSKEYGTDPMYVSIHLNSKKITQEQYDEIKALEKEWRDALGEAKKVGGDVYAVYLRMEDPLYYTYDGITDHTLSMQAKAQGKDGLIVEPMTEYVAFNPTQIKSVANVGSFSRETGNIFYQGVDEYGALHRPPNPSNGAPGHDLTGGGLVYPDDVYSKNQVAYYGHGDDVLDRSSFRVLNMIKGNPDSDVVIYRAIPKGIKGAKISAGDWITVSLQYAKEHGESQFDEYKIIKKTVKAKEIFTNGDSIHEFGYWPEGSYEKLTGTDVLFQSAYHGTPHKFDKFSLDAIGTGEGAQAYGWGLYFASEKSVAEFYRDNVVDASRIGEINNRLSELVKEMDQYRGVGYGKFTDKKGYDLQAEYESLVKEKEDKGNLYQVEIPEDTELLHWDKPLSEQPESVRRALEELFKGIDGSYLEAVKKYDDGDKKALKNAGFNLFDYPGAAGGMYERLAFLNNPKKASKIMNGKGIKGIKYLDGSSRGKGEGSYNYVIFDDKVVTIEAVNDEMRQAESLFQNKPDPLGATYQMPLGDRVIKLFEKSNPSTMLHEMSHLFLLMEQDFADKYGMTETHKDLLKWLGVESFDQITKDHHEQFAGSFEAYIMEGKSPSIALSDVFAAAKHWMLQVYEFIRNIPNQKIDPEISSIFDRLLATEQQLEEVKGSPMYNQFFADKDEAGWSNKDWIDYIGLQARRENKAKETIDQKLMKEWKRMRTKEWVEERNAIQETEEAVLKASPVYRAMASMREFKLNRDQALEAMGLEVPLSAEDRARKAAMPKPTDSLLVFAAKRGGLNIEAYKKAGIDPADMKKTQSGVFGKPVFTKDGMTPTQFNEAATEAGYMESRGYTIDAETYDDLVDDNDVLDLVTRSVIQGEEFFTVEGDAIRQEEADKQRYLDQYFEEHGQYPPEEVVEETPEQKLAKSLKKYLSTDGMPVEMTATEHGYGSAKEMIEAVLAAPKIKDQAKINADEAMVAKYGTLLDDATLEAEVRDAVQNEEQAKLLLMEIKALGKVAKKKEINRDYLKMKATRLVDEMKRSDMRTGGVYRRMIKAAEAAKKANAEAAKIRAAIAKEKEAAAGELAAEVGERAVEAQKQLEEAEKDYKKKKEIMQDVYEDLKRAKEKAKETDKRKKELRDIKDLKKALGARKKSGEEINEEEYKAENKAITARINEAMERVNESAKADLSRQAAIVRLEKDYDVSRAEAQAARKLADTMKERAEKQVTRATEKEGKVEDAKSETAKKQAELEAELVAVAEKALEFKIQHLANHYLYQEITDRKAAMDKQLTYLRRVDGKDYDPKVVDPDYIAQAKKLIRLYNTVTKSKKDEQRLTEELSGLLTWYDTQVKAAETLDQDEGGNGNRQPLLWLSEELIAALAAKREGNLAEFKLKQISNMTAAEVQGLYDTIKHIRYIGGKTSEDAKAEYQKSQEEIADNIKENAGKTIKRKHEKNVFDRTKESLGAYWHSMESSSLMFSILDGFSNGPIMKHWESFIDAVNKHIELERDFAKTIDGIMRPILVKIASPIKVTITKEDGVSWSLSKQARFVLLLNMGNQSNIDTVLQGMNANFDDSYTYNDLMQMVSGMSKAELEAANKIWAYKDQTLWPAISAIQRKVSGVSAAKIEPVPFVVNGVEMIGGHYRLHYKADQKDQGRDFELESVGKMKMLMGKQASQIERVGSGGREVDLEHIHLYTDISQELRFIAFKEFSISISKFLNGANNPVRAAIIQHHGAEFLKYLEDTINGVVNRPANAMDMFSRGSRAIRSNMVYSYLSFSLRSIVQAFSAVAPMMSQLGEARTLMAFMEFWSNPYGNFKKVDSMSMAMKERLKFVNHEATTELSKLSVWSPVVNQMKKAAFMPHAVIDAFFAYPAWMGAKRKYLDENPVDSKTDFKRREKLANDFADLTMKQIMGSGHKADVGGVFSSPDEMVKSILFMGTFSNSMFNTNAYNIEKFKAGKMPWYELARRQGWMMIGAPLIWLAVLDEFPDPEDENYWLKMAGQIVGYNFSMLVAANHVYNYAVNDFEFTLPLMKAVESTVGLSRSGKALVMGEEEFDLKMQAKIVRDLGPLIPMFGGSEMSRIMKGIEEERDWYSTYVTGKRD